MKEDNSGWAQLSFIGLQLGLSIAAGLAIGYYLDQWLHTSPWMLIIWLLFGIAAGFYKVFETVSKISKKNDN